MAWLQVSFSLTLIAYLTTDAQFLAWGWRIPFLFSAVLIVLALWIRSSIQETAAFQEQKDSGDIANLPIAETFKYHRKSLFHVIGLKFGDGYFNVFLMSFILVYATNYLGYSNENALTALTIGCATMVITIPLIGFISDFIDRKIIYISGLILLFVLAIPYFIMIEQGVTWLYYSQAALLGCYLGISFCNTRDIIL